MSRMCRLRNNWIIYWCMCLSWYCHKQTLASSITLNGLNKSTWGHYCPTGWVSNCDRQYLAFAFSTSSLIQCKIVYNRAIEQLLMWHLLYFGRIFKPCGFWMKLKENSSVFLFQFHFLLLCHFRNFPKITCSPYRRTNWYTTTLFKYYKNT